MTIAKYASREWRRRIRDVLNREWDPIGGCPEDEYDTYAGKLAAMIRDKASDEDLTRYLEWAEAEHMGFGKFNSERGRKVVQSLRNLGPAPDTRNLN
jgi:hypothetical protein